MSPHQAAAQEALEEAGVIGEIGRKALGTFRYPKQLASGAIILAKVTVFPLAVSRELDDWPEKDIREQAWFSQDEAVEAVQEPELKQIIRFFSPPD
jgi:8-oxo-dGTP pyrophosphatase MutT (NUDIX family)